MNMEFTNYLRQVAIVSIAGSRVLREIVLKILTEYPGQSLETFLNSKRNILDTLVGERNVIPNFQIHLFPPDGNNINMDTWDISLLTFVLLNAFDNIPVPLQKGITQLQQMNEEYVSKPVSTAVTWSEFLGFCKEFDILFSQFVGYISGTIRHQVELLVDDLKNMNADDIGEKLRSLQPVDDLIVYIRPQHKENRNGQNQRELSSLLGSMTEKPTSESGDLEMNADDSCLSLRVYETLERIGASEEMRRIHNENVVGDIIQGWSHSFGLSKDVSLHTCGSWCEGTTTPGMGSDVDKILVRDYVHVKADITDVGNGNSLLMFQDDQIQPGFYKLQLVRNAIPQTKNEHDDTPGLKIDRNGRLCFEHDILQGRDRHGPANTSDSGGGLMIDSVVAFRCDKIPTRYTDWIHRKRHHDWPPRDLLDRMAHLSCFVVCVGYEGSEERDIEWRLSFSLQERELMLSLNPVQHKCYILMKLIKKDIIQPFIGEVDSISSYHCKTCLFYAIENSPQEIWTPENLLPCLFRCLNHLFECVSRGNCPNYFITGSNMFDRIGFRKTQTVIIQSLQDILNEGYRVLFRLKTDMFGESLTQAAVLDRNIQVEYRFKLEITKVHNPLYWSQLFLMQLHSYNDQDIVFLIEMLDSLQGIACTKDHSEKHTSEAVSYLLPWVYQRLATASASLALGNQLKSEDQPIRLLLSTMEEYFKLGMATDLLNTHLMMLAVLYKLEKYEECKMTLKKIELSLSRYIVYVCLCNLTREAKDNIELVNKITDERLSTKEILYTAVASCIKFLPSEVNIVPPPLEYELYRSLFTSPGSRDERKQCWFDWIVVDANVFLYFMQYLVFSKLDLKDQKRKAVENIESLISGVLYHKETAYNLLGWIHQQELRHEEALKCWAESLRIRPDHNAAKYHIPVLLCNCYKNTHDIRDS